ncbi:MAG TPA: adenylate/guanylate cyclase domain-containing protein, partial [Candidatus Methylomirabilis sp.]|nr:adenylate/guanylate cyclase domain-containing protein [Candidatus Methylomirabilis sp.]
RFCGECGLSFASSCPSCGFQNEGSEKFCGGCGAPIAGSRSAADTKLSSPESYTPKHLAEKILTSKSAMEGERKNVTVMFADVSGFTAMSERLDPEEVHAIMDRAFEVILDVVHRYEGTINQFLGDGVMALFGAPIAHEDHPHRALCAALAIQEGLHPLREEVRRTHGVEFRVRMGLNTGFVVVGAIGKDLRMDYTAVGDTTNLAARLMSLAQPGQVVVSQPTQRRREGFFVFEDLGEFQVKGKTEPVRAYALISEIHGRTRLEVSKERGLTPLTGRDGELARLNEAYQRAAGGQGAIALIMGDAGAGKSRLLYEFLWRLDRDSILELETTCAPYGRSMAYRPVLELVRKYLDLIEGLSAEDIRRRVTERLRLLGLENDERAIVLAHLLGVSAPPEFLNRLGGAGLKERIFG